VSRIIDIEGTSQNGPPGGVMMQNGTVTYSFMPTLATGKHLTSASLDSTNQNMKGGGPPGGPAGAPGAPTVKAEVWDWANSAWISLAYNLNGTSTLPTAALDPSSGEVRLRLTATGGQTMLGSISLTGTVE
jgi:hypothetical protein